MQPDIVTALEGVARICDRLGLRLLVGGSVATSTYGVARATLDVDVVIDLPLPLVSEFAGALEQDYYIEESAVRESVRSRSSFNLIHLATMVKIDVFVPARSGFQRISFDRDTRDSLDVADGAREYCIATPEDMILHKLRWFDLGEQVATRQLDDVVGVLRVQGETLDRQYLQDWAEALDVVDLLDRALLLAEEE